MASGKLSPRQKMINLMYLVFIAMLAMNMSKEVLSAFGFIKEEMHILRHAYEKTPLTNGIEFHTHAGFYRDGDITHGPIRWLHKTQQQPPKTTAGAGKAQNVYGKKQCP